VYLLLSELRVLNLTYHNNYIHYLEGLRPSTVTRYLCLPCTTASTASRSCLSSFSLKASSMTSVNTDRQITFPAPSAFQFEVEDIVMCSSASTMPSCGSILNYICPYLLVTEIDPTELLKLVQTLSDLSCRFNPRDSQHLYLNDDASLMNSHISAIDPTVVFIHGFTQTADSLSASTVRDGKLLHHIGALVAMREVAS